MAPALNSFKVFHKKQFIVNYDWKWRLSGFWKPCPRYLSDPNGEGARGEQTQKPDQRLREVLHQHGEERQAAEHHGQHGAHRAGKLGLLKQRRQHEGEKDLWNETEEQKLAQIVMQCS